MKLSAIPSFAIALLIAQTTLAQMVSIASPATGETLFPGQSVVVELNSADGLTNFQHISVALGVGPAADPNANGSTLGTVLFAGNFTPQRHEADKPEYQNFTLTMPSTLQAGPSQLNVAHFYLVGAGLEPILEMKNISLTVASASRLFR